LNRDRHRLYNGLPEEMSSIFRCDANGTSPAFGFPTMTFGGQPFLFGRPRRFGWPSRPGFFSGLANQGNQARDGVLAIAVLGSMTLGFNDQNSIGGHAMTGDFF
jgi:hypothetical protein